MGDRRRSDPLSGSRFYRIYGVGAHWASNRGQPWLDSIKDNRELLARRIGAEDSNLRPMPGMPVELVLGIVHSGASYLLFDEKQLQFFCKQHNVSWPQLRGDPPTNYLSLSPVYYPDTAALSVKLEQLAPISKKNKQGDYSKLNRRYVSADIGGRPDNKKFSVKDNLPTEPPGRARSEFEHNRLLYRIWHNTAHFDYEKFAISKEPWLTRNLRVCSLYFTMWEVPDVAIGSLTDFLEVGWTKLIPDPEGDFYDKRCLPLLTSRKNKAGPSAEHTEQPMAHGDLVQELREFCSSLTGAPPGTSTLVLVYNEPCTRRVLTRCGINISKWESGVDGLLERIPTSYSNSSRDRGGRYNTRDYSYSGHGSSYYDRDVDYNTDRKVYDDRNHRRSRSPGRLEASTSRRDYKEEQKPLPPPTVHLVDVARLQRALFSDDSCEPSISYDDRLRHDARTLGLEHERGYCAKNESFLLVRMWKKMMNGNAIDDQREELKKREFIQEASGLSSNLGKQQEDCDSDDPNAPRYPRMVFEGRNPFELDSDDSDAEYAY